MSDISSIQAGIGIANPLTDKLLSQASSAGENGKIDKSAKDFESILLGNWLQGAEQSFAKIPGTDEDDADSEENSAGGQFLDLAMQSLGGSLAGSGGIGIGKMIANQLHKTEDAKTQSASAPNPER